MDVKTENPWKAQNKNEMRKNFLPIFIWETDEKQKKTVRRYYKTENIL